jgi:uncharacterized protein (TIGR00255 family)
MAISMTGYGCGEATEAERRVTVEIKTVNNRYCEIQIRLPRILASLENKVREEIARQITRGKVDVVVSYEDNSPEAYQITCDVGLARAYAKALRDIAESAGVPDDASAGFLSRFSDVLSVEPARIDQDQIWLFIRTALLTALAGLGAMRRLEGGRLTEDILQRIGQLEDRRLQIFGRAPQVVDDYRARLQERVKVLLGDRSTVFFDEQRLAAEVALFADKCSIDEELVRLGSHLRQASDVICQDEQSGKKMDFLVQEINREINTIGSKANDLAIVNDVVIMKTEVEKIREQIQNLE